MGRIGMDEEQDITELLDAIIWGRRIVSVSDSDGDKHIYVFRPLTLEERNMSNYFYKEELANSRLKTRKQLIQDAIKHGLWEKSYEEQTGLLVKEKAKLSSELEKQELADRGRQTPRAKTIRLRDRLIHVSSVLSKLDMARTRYIDLPSAEYHAECRRGTYSLRCATLSFPEMSQVWGSLKELNEESETGLVSALLGTYYDQSIASDTQIRMVARSGYWRCKWMGAKKNRGVKTLFNREMYDLTMDQFRLMYWSQVYDSAFESMEPPSDQVVDDDSLFDKWLDAQQQKRKQEHKKSAFDKKVSHLTKDGQEVGFNVQGKFSEECSCGILEQAVAGGDDKRGHLHDTSCSYGVFLYYDNEQKMQKVEEVQSANTERTRKVLGNEQKRLSNMSPDGMQEQNLRGDKTRVALGLNTTTHGAGEYGKNKK
jgi:hypothetical protein